MFNIPDSEKQNNTSGNVPGGDPERVSAERPPLSTLHIRPRIEFVEGASLLKATKGEKGEAPVGGKRGAIKGFSRAARRRLMREIARVKTAEDLPCFVTLTYPGVFPTVERAKRDLKVFAQRLERAFSTAGGFWKLEPQERGAPHYHMLIWGVPEHKLLRWVVDTWYEIAGNGDIMHKLFHLGCLRESKPCVTQVRSWKGVWSYASKYIGKTFEVAEWGKQWTGRFWGVIQKENIPFGESKVIEVSKNYVVRIMRYQRRFSGLKKGSGNSLTIFCDADQWITQLAKEFYLST